MSAWKWLSATGLLLVVTCSAPAAQTPPKAAIASAHPLATAAGFEILEKGGNAFDAAVAVAAALAVVEPYGSGLGGGGFFLLHQAGTGNNVVVDARETAPGQAVPEMYQDRKGEVVRDWVLNGPLGAAIPGAPAGLAHVAQKYGALPLSVSLAPAIRLARDGFPVDDRFRTMARMRLDVLRRFAGTSTIFLVNGDVPNLGTLIRQPALAATLDVLASEGHDGFYKGKLTSQIVGKVIEAGGIWDEQDFADYRVIEREALVGNFRGARIVTVPPPSAGGVAILQILNTLDHSPLGNNELVAREHALVEAMRRAFRDRELWLGDPAFTDIPLAKLVSPEYGAALAYDIDAKRATPSAALGKPMAPAPQGDNTTHFSILDKAGNRVAATLSINTPFGSGFTVAGMLLNNEMDDFATAPGAANAYGLPGSTANAIAPGKRPLSSMSPTFIEYNDRVAILGTPGGSRIPGMVVNIALALLEARDPRQSLAAPRFHHQYLPDAIEVEPEFFGSAQARALRAMGHTVTSTGRPFGNVQLILWEKTSGNITAVSDPRGIGHGLAR